MTHLEKLIQAHVEHATVTTISTATEKIAEDMAREILNDPAWREEMRALIRRNFADTVAALRHSNGSRRPARAARGRRKRSQ